MDITETIAEILRLDAQATPGPWETWGGSVVEADETAYIVHGDEANDATLIAYYRTAAPALAREVQRLQAEVCEARIGRDCAIVAAHESGRRAGQEAMRERAAALVDRAADAACECDGTLCGPDDVAPHDEDCRRFDLDDLADAIRALEVSHD